VDRFRDTAYLCERQYGDSAKLQARITIHERCSTATRGWHEWIFDEMAPVLVSGARVLEVGAGAGTLWAKNAARLPPIDLVLSDVSAGMLDDARDTLVGIVPGVRWLVADAQRVPFPADSFDVVIANAMLYHVPDLSQALAELRRALRGGGTFFASTFGASHFCEVHALLDELGAQREQHIGDRFQLESGHDALTRVFDDVAVHRYADGLVITDGDLLADFLASMIGVETIDAAVLDARAHALASQPGGWHVTKDGGLLVAR
jgi:SAM-dependent methyltransferase